jgi:hypothetical protein
MMSGDGFDRRGEGFETKYEREQDQKFRVMARRDKLFARWAADMLSLEGDEVEKYEKDVIRAALAEAGDDDILRKVSSDLQGKGVQVSDEDLLAELAKCASAAAKKE